jgi:4-hydroxybenzoate polyprenyltransferase
MSTSVLTLQSPLRQRLGAWFNERFPPANALLFVILYLTCVVIARQLQGQIALSLADVVGALVAWSWFLLLRIFDEHKDYQIDLHNHPQRILQSGLITLGHLRMLGAIAIVSQILWSLYLDQWQPGAALQAWAMMFFWTCLMGKEFFCGVWLEKHLTLYAFSHMLVMPLIVWWLANLGAPGLPLSASVIWLMALAFVSGFAFEITRKTKGAEEERDSVDSYSRIFGARGAVIVILLLTLTMLTIQLLLVWQLADKLPLWALAILLISLGLPLMTLRRYWQQATERARKHNEAAVALLMLIGYAVTIAVALGSAPVKLAGWLS